MKNRSLCFGLLFCIFLSSLLQGPWALPPGPQGSTKSALDAQYTSIGSYVRIVLGIDLYEVSLESLAPEKLAELYSSYAQRRNAVTGVDELAVFLLDPGNHIPMRLQFRSLTDLKNWQAEKGAIRTALARTGLAVDRKWNIKAGGPLQQDVLEYVDAIVGVKRERSGSVFNNRRKNDITVLAIDEQASGSIHFFPMDRHRRDKALHIDLRSSEVLRRIFSYYLSTEFSPRELKDMPPALLRGILDQLASEG